ncbi:MAG: hypothetical protein JWM78_3490 [Verrucomicrobiaceae bacterium]|nr:hypothetical protein [Verrucomicrobiaceae bacterium]
MMNVRMYLAVSAVLFFLLCMINGCAPAKRPFLMVQVCFKDEQNLELFIDTMKSIAQLERMNFIDNSRATQKDLVALKVAGPTDRAINIGAEGNDGMWVTASNLGLPSYQVTLGFFEGSRSLEARKFADRVVGELTQRWHIEYVPSGQGAFPMKNCE